MSSSKTPEKRIRRRSNARRHGAATATKTAWLTRLAPAAAAALLVLTAVAGPPTGLMQAATAAGFGLGKENEKEPVMQALVQLPDDETNWKKFMDSEDQTTGASLLITATPEAGKSSVLGATVAMDKVRLPTMIQLFPANAMDGAKWPIDFDTEADYDVKVTVCAGGEREGLACKSPSLSGSGESMFVRQLEDVPEIAEMGGARVPAAVVLEPISR